MPELSSAEASAMSGGRRSAAEYAQAFGDVAPPLTRTQALVEAERCFYCYDAPCTTACPTGIDIPSFIRRIAEDNLRGAARDHPRSEHPRRHVRARLPDRGAVRAGLRAGRPQQDKPVEIGGCSAMRPTG